MSDIPSQMHPFSITLWRVVLIFMLFFFSKVLPNSLSAIREYDLIVFQGCLIHMDL